MAPTKLEVGQRVRCVFAYPHKGKTGIVQKVDAIGLDIKWDGQ